MIRAVLVCAVLSVVGAPAAAEKVSLGRGTPLEVARRVLAEHYRPICVPVRASRRKDRTIRAVCPDGAVWILWKERGYDPALIPCADAHIAGLKCRLPPAGRPNAATPKRYKK